MKDDKARPPDPDDLNEDRSDWAEAAIQTFMDQTRTDREDALADLLCDLMHWCDRNGTDFRSELERAQGNYDAETRDEE